MKKIGIVPYLYSVLSSLDKEKLSCEISITLFNKVETTLTSLVQQSNKVPLLSILVVTYSELHW